ncbi:MAG TPA: LysM peptidoglycan-binding domain-containing protein, partial [Firmicutes bacterium]|nr:LysM peptidoglycan-binding domain-containing protein [Bacillota bacterium]
TEIFPVNITVRLPGITAGEKLSVEGTAIARQYTLFNAPADKLEWKLRLEIKIAARGWRFLEAVNHVSGRGLQVTRATHTFKQLVREMELVGKIQTSVELPVIASGLLQVDAVLTGISAEIFDGEVIARGVLCSRFIFLDAGDILRCYRHELPLTIREKLPGARPSFAIQALPGTVNQICCQAVAPNEVDQSAEIRIPVAIFEESGLELVSEIKAAPGGQRIYKLYIAQIGDTWSKIAGRFGVPPEVLTSINIRVEENGRLLPKQKVYIPLNR